eukprot:TRINITY_DN14186_c0_g1_i3.p1 TRINITY_DN14186_c0_g1~~TRINITY_DN14186_c0_g1_i3.p1  ORF type:complete len:170 (+),score=41.73 TRINITY_DN14186_c0_g1_i3:309-818(+)
MSSRFTRNSYEEAASAIGHATTDVYAVGPVNRSASSNREPNENVEQVKKLAKSLWKDIVAWAGENERALMLFRADHQATPRGLEPGTPPAEWCFIPMSDLVLVVGAGLVGITAEGVFCANRAGFQRKSLAKLYKPKDDKPAAEEQPAKAGGADVKALEASLLQALGSSS